MSKKIICLFDVDGTLTDPRQVLCVLKESVFKGLYFSLNITMLLLFCYLID